MTESNASQTQNGNLRIRLGVIITLVGFFIFLLGADPDFFGLDGSPAIGFVQISTFLFGLGVICFGGYFSLDTLWHGRQKTIPADIGPRLVATGYVFALVSGMADVFGLGTRPLPDIPFFGYWQETGVLIGEGIIILGFLLMLPFGRWRKPKK